MGGFGADRIDIKARNLGLTHPHGYCYYRVVECMGYYWNPEIAGPESRIAEKGTKKQPGNESEELHMYCAE